MNYLGCHVGLSAPAYFLGSVTEAFSYEATTFMFYTGAPQNTKRKPLEELKIPEGIALLKEHGLDPSKVIVHAPYIINLANKDKEETYELGKSFLLEELKRTDAFNVKNLVLHPGSHVGHDEQHGLDSLLSALTEVIEKDDTDVAICLETMAGKGSEVGVNFEFFQKFFAAFPYPDRIGICLDTCHIHDAGYDVSNASALLDEFDRIIGIDKLKVVHLNDSKNHRGAHKDRHENLGYGCIGFDALNAFAHEPRLENIPIILETPWFNEKPPYAKEISLLRKGEFEAGWRDNLAQQSD